MDSKNDMTDALELLKWQLELGVDENVGNIPLNRFSDHSQQNEVEIEIPVSTQQKMPKIELLQNEWRFLLFLLWRRRKMLE